MIKIAKKFKLFFLAIVSRSCEHDGLTCEKDVFVTGFFLFYHLLEGGKNMDGLL